MKTIATQTTDGFENTCERDRGFTLTELLVVMATLALLAGLILPALAKSGDNSARTVCLNNLRQMGTALNLYAGENQDYLPWPNWGSDSAAPRGWLYAGDPTTFPITTGKGGPNSVKFWAKYQVVHLMQGVFWQYVLNGKAFLCPNDLKPTYNPSSLWYQRNCTLSTYVMNGAACFFAAPNSQYNYLTPKISQIWSPSCIILFEPDQLIDPGCYNDGAYIPGPDARAGTTAGEGFAPLHTPGVNLLTVSGGTRVLSSADITAAQTAPGKGILWWNPKTVDGR
ncbi:MAG: type II secretion system protein [Verrucomicrobiia bacterium]